MRTVYIILASAGILFVAALALIALGAAHEGSQERRTYLDEEDDLRPERRR